MADELDDIAAEEIDYFDPEEELETDNLEGDDEAHPGDDDEPSLEDETEGAEENPDGEDAETETDDPVIDLDGEQVPLSQLKQERMFQQDYSRKTAELAQERQVTQQARTMYSQQQQQVNSLLQETVAFLEGVIPEAPPISLAQTNPDQFQYQKALREQALQEMQGIITRSQRVQQSAQQVQKFDSGQAIATHVAGLERSFPHLKGDQSKLVSFVTETRKGAEEFGFSAQELGGVTDNRLLTMAHYAALGKKAEHNRNAAKRRLTSPKKGVQRTATGQTKGAGNRKAMQRLAQTGSLNDALNIDFE